MLENHRANDLVELSSGRLRLSLAPAVGGSIARFDYEDAGSTIPILRGSQGSPASVLDTASFPLVPYSNRIRAGRFGFRGREVAIAPNMSPDPSPLHGQGWLAPWQVEEASGTSAALAYRHEPGEWPWAYLARQLFALDDRGLTLGLSCTNLSDEPMPCGLGQHPYFPCDAGTTLDTEVEGAWTIDEKVLPVERVPATGKFDLTNRSVCGQDLDHGFDGWGGIARVQSPGVPFRLEMSSPTARCFQLYSPASGGLFVAEPVTHTNAALNAPEEQWQALGLRVLEPSEEMSLEMRLEIIAAD